jgi:hypothetical protein
LIQEKDLAKWSGNAMECHRLDLGKQDVPPCYLNNSI